MLTLNDGRSELWQWDTGRTLDVDADCSQVHFSNKVFGRSIDVDVADGVAIIPDVLLQTDKDLNVWAFVGTAENGYTKISKTFKVNRRNKPADYVFTPVEQTTIAEIAAIAQSVRDDADAGLFDGRDGVDGKDGAPGRDGVDGKDGAPGKDGISATHQWNGTVLTVTSASGTSSSDLKGEKGNTGPAGKDGTPGADGKTPVYGVDYGTTEQIAYIANQAADILQPEVNQIKGDLSDKLPKSPVNWEPWTDTEQEAARERIGIPGDYDLIEEIICDGKASIYNRDVEPDGNPYTFRSIYIELEIQPSNVYSAVFFRAYKDDGAAVLYDGIPTSSKSYTSYLFAGCDVHSGFYRGWMIYSNVAKSDQGGAERMRINKPEVVTSPIKRVMINHNGGVFFDGDKIRIYGVRA